MTSFATGERNFDMSDRLARTGQLGASSSQFERGRIFTMNEIDLNFWNIMASFVPDVLGPDMDLTIGPGEWRFQLAVEMTHDEQARRTWMVLAALCKAPLETVLQRTLSDSSTKLLVICVNWSQGKGVMLGETVTEEKQATALWRDRRGVFHLLHERMLPIKRQLTGGKQEEHSIRTFHHWNLVTEEDHSRLDTDWKEIEHALASAKALHRRPALLPVVFIDGACEQCPTLTKGLTWATPGWRCFALPDEPTFDILVEDWFVFADRCKAAVRPGGADIPEGREVQLICPEIDFAWGPLPRLNETLCLLCPHLSIVDGDLNTATPLTRQA